MLVECFSVLSRELQGYRRITQLDCRRKCESGGFLLSVEVVSTRLLDAVTDDGDVDGQQLVELVELPLDVVQRHLLRFRRLLPAEHRHLIYYNSALALRIIIYNFRRLLPATQRDMRDDAHAESAVSTLDTLKHCVSTKN